jgi:hypothetical protein
MLVHSRLHHMNVGFGHKAGVLHEKKKIMPQPIFFSFLFFFFSSRKFTLEPLVPTLCVPEDARNNNNTI